MGSSSARRTFAVSFTAVLLLEIAWATALPLFRGPDEISHLYRASAVALGQWEASGGENPTRVEADLVAAASETCHKLYDEHLPAVCEPTIDHGHGIVGVASTADRYNPAYYAVAGAPGRWLDGDVAVWAMRLASALACATLLAWAWSMALGARTVFPAVGLLVATTPAVLFAGSVFAPNGLHFAAALLVWSSLLAMHRRSASARSAAAASAIGGSTLLLTHSTGPLWLATIVLVMLVMHGARAAVETVRGAPRAWASAVAIVIGAAVTSILWTLTAATNAPTAGGEPLADDTKEIGLLANVVLWLLQTIGTMPYRFGLVWMIVYILWLLPLTALLVLGLRSGRTRRTVAAGLALGLSIAIPGLLTAISYEALGYAWQGRYGLPLLFGVVLIAAENLELTRASARPIPLFGLVGTLAIAHYLALLCVGLREASGPYDDGRPWGLLLGVATLLCIGLGYGALGLRTYRVGRTS